MKKILLILLFCSTAYATDFDRKTVWTTGDLITATRLNADPDETARILGVDSDGLISDGNITGGAHIAETKIKFLPSSGHDHDGTDSALLNHINSRVLRIGGSDAHVAGTSFSISVGNASEVARAHPSIRFDVDAGVWQLSNDGISFSQISVE